MMGSFLPMSLALPILFLATLVAWPWQSYQSHAFTLKYDRVPSLPLSSSRHTSPFYNYKGNSPFVAPTRYGLVHPQCHYPPYHHSYSLNNLRHLVEDIPSHSSSSSTPQTLFVGGKGGVGKTTVASSLAVALSSDPSSPRNVLIVSTDPAHSLADCLDCKPLTGDTPYQFTDALTGGRLYAIEVDASSKLSELRELLASIDVKTLGDALGVSPEVLQSLGLEEFADVLKDVPPGMDEIVALSYVMEDQTVRGVKFDVIIVDSAPTGHTLRMLELPTFIVGFLEKLVKLRMRLKGLTNSLSTFVSDEDANTKDPSKVIDKALNRIDMFRRRMEGLKTQLKDPVRTRFVVVTVPTQLGVNESRRLMVELDRQGVKMSEVVVNQCVMTMVDDDISKESNTEAYYQRLKRGQDKWLKELRTVVDKVEMNEDYMSQNRDPIHITQVPYFDRELVGTHDLALIGKKTFATNPGFQYLMTNDDAKSDKIVICGGKGGVGKTTMSSSLAIAMAEAGHTVALVSTDPAHSLGDAFDMDLSGGDMVNVALAGCIGRDGSLSILEVDPTTALHEFKNLMDQFLGGKEKDGVDSTDTNDTNVTVDGLRKTLRSLGEMFDTLPAGTDEVVALAKVIGLIQKGNFSRIILDTAPTGHTLRMLNTPMFLSNLIEKVLTVAQKLNANILVKMMINTAASGKDLERTMQAARQKLVSFQFLMYDLEELFSDPERTDFLLVTLPTELAVRETTRLLTNLVLDSTDMPIKVLNIVANQLLAVTDCDIVPFFQNLVDRQKSSIRNLKDAIKEIEVPVGITEVPYLDMEPRGVYALKVLAGELLDEGNC